MLESIQKTDTIYRLIHSMSKGEKRHFQINYSTAIGSGKHYLDLYRAYYKLNNYSYDGLIANLPKSFPIDRLNQIKNYLKGSLIRSIEGFNTKCKKATILKLISQSNTLFARGFINESYKHACSAHKIAKNYWIHSLELDTYNIFLKICQFLGEENKLGLIEKELIADRSKLIRSINRINTTDLLNGNNAKSTKGFQTFLEETKNDDPDELSEWARINGYHTSAKFLFDQKEYEEALHYSNQEMELWNNSGAVNGDCIYMGSYMQALFLRIKIKQRLGEQMECKKILQLIKTKSEYFIQQPSLEIEFKYHYLITLITLYPTLQEEKYLNQFIEELREENFCLKLKVQQRLKLIMSISCHYFKIENWKMSLYWINILINEKIPSSHFYFLAKARFLQVILYFEQGKEDLAMHFINKIKNNKYLNKKEKITISVIHSDLNSHKHNISFEEAYTEIQRENVDENNGIDGIDLLLWIKKQMNRKVTLS